MLLGYTNTEFEDVIYECGDGNVFIFLAGEVQFVLKLRAKLTNEKVKFLILKILHVTTLIKSTQESQNY